MIHLLYGSAHPSQHGKKSVLTYDELYQAGVHCNNDTYWPMMDAGIVEFDKNEYSLSKTAREMIRSFTVAKGPESHLDIRIDYPEVFVVMPFGETWSSNVYNNIFRPAIKDAGFAESRGDAIVRVGDLNTNVWQSITQAGVILAEVSAPNPNVYYEIGLATALGKPVFLFKQKDVKLPADFGGAHYYEYELKDPDATRKKLSEELRNWANHRDHLPFGVKKLVDGL